MRVQRNIGTPDFPLEPGDEVELPREVVIAEDLAAVIDPIIRRKQNEYESTSGPGMPAPLGAMQQLAFHSGVPERSIFRILKGESLTVDLDIADRLLIALDLRMHYALPESAIVLERDAHHATTEQTELLRQVARRRGEFVPQPGSKAMRTWAGPMRRKLHREQQEAA